jgi:glycosyltransferase involved in cell wall biosynthesis
MQSGLDKRDPIHSAIFSRLSGWYTLTEIMRREVLTYTDMPSSRVHVAYLGRGGETFRPSSHSRMASRKKMRIPANSMVVGVLGRLDRQKGQMELLRAIPHVIKKIPNALCVIAGDETKNDPGMRTELKRLASELNIQKQVRILPPTNNVPEFLSALDIFTMPSYSETYGLVLIEAMAMALPVISTNSGGVPELARHQQEGLIVEPKDIEGLTTAIVRLGTDPALRRGLGSNSRKRFLDVFEETRCIDRLARLLDQR